MRVKICGITSYKDAVAAIDAGADALGFVFYNHSARYISPDDAAKIIQKLPPFVERVALFVNEKANFIDEVCLHVNASLAQIHFEADRDLFDALRTKHVKVIRAKTRDDIFQHPDEYRLIDTYTKEYGGSGELLNLDWFNGIDCSTMILAGGLTPENIFRLAKYNFYGVDVSSGVEKSKGIKDHQKIRNFIDNVNKYLT